MKPGLPLFLSHFDSCFGWLFCDVRWWRRVGEMPVVSAQRQLGHQRAVEKGVEGRHEALEGAERPGKTLKSRDWHTGDRKPLTKMGSLAANLTLDWPAPDLMPSLEARQPSVAPARRPASESCPSRLFLPNKRQACHQRKKRKEPLLHTGFCLDGVTDTLKLFTSASERAYPPACFTAARPRQDACGLPLNTAFATQPRPPASVLPSATDTTSTRKSTRSWTSSTSASPNLGP